MWESWRHHNTQKRIIILGLKLNILYRTQTLLTPKKRKKKKKRRERERAKKKRKRRWEYIKRQSLATKLVVA